MDSMISTKEGYTSSMLERFNDTFRDAEPEEVLRWGVDKFGTDMVLGTGFGPSGVLLIHKIHQCGYNIPVFYLDTDLLFGETYKLRDQLAERFNIEFIRVSTDLSLEEQAEEYGERLWESQPDKCCYLRKVLPLRKYLNHKSAWITGIRRSQSPSRANAEMFEWDAGNKVLKINPLVHWSSEQLWSYIHLHELPYNPLHDQGYPSIGCWPCTRPVENGDDERSGRWSGWNKTECGIHVSNGDT